MRNDESPSPAQPQPNDGTIRVCRLIGKHFTLPRVHPCSPWLLLAAQGRTTGNTGKPVECVPSGRCFRLEEVRLECEKTNSTCFGLPGFFTSFVNRQFFVVACDHLADARFGEPLEANGMIQLQSRQPRFEGTNLFLNFLVVEEVGDHSSISTRPFFHVQRIDIV